ncbi:hypothetical protein [Mesorhizobium captivum]|uniref:hypothetical protein n=1 Tax=Mesorhizobium captivum TaxID=3072319 RepID=UPI002A243631|nr:hypothetical protein [Mesorhizobium sp. VK23E]MDX8514668.1 hypothetical protein [Mesorhizobium sp. VK23E]
MVVGRGEDIAADARKLGAHRYIDANKENATDTLNGMGGAKAILRRPAIQRPSPR